MAISAPLITAAYAGSYTSRSKTLSITGKAVWSESAALPYTTVQVAPPLHDNAGDPIFVVVFPADTIVAIGAAPNASTGPRFYVPANTERTFYAQPGDKLAAVAA